jgi:hypothetical protein
LVQRYERGEQARGYGGLQRSYIEFMRGKNAGRKRAVLICVFVYITSWVGRLRIRTFARGIDTTRRFLPSWSRDSRIVFHAQHAYTTLPVFRTAARANHPYRIRAPHISHSHRAMPALTPSNAMAKREWSNTVGQSGMTPTAFSFLIPVFIVVVFAPL